MSINIDETQSEEVAFQGLDKQEDVFKFDEPATADKVEDSTSGEDTNTDVADSTATESTDEAQEEEAEEKRVPYSRFKSVKDELGQRDEMINNLEARLASLETARTESNTVESVDVPQEWVELYGDSEASKRAFKIQIQREQQIEASAVQKALNMFKEEANREVKQTEENESIIEDNLSSLQQSLGKKFTPKVEEDVLAIVDEFSPVGEDGKYVSLFPFDKAYEIYELRNAQAKAPTNKARQQVADLTSNNSTGEADSSEAPFERGWDNWRKAL